MEDYKSENFGPTGVLDWLFGTDKAYQEWLRELGRRDKSSRIINKEEEPGHVR